MANPMDDHVHPCANCGADVYCEATFCKDDTAYCPCCAEDVPPHPDERRY